MQLKAGMRLQSVACDTQLVVVKAPAGADVDLRVGGHPVVTVGATYDKQELAADAKEGTAMGKRYADEAGTIEVLCSKPGQGSITFNGAPLPLKEAKPLPSSD
ncbi:MAG: hypothetical protein AB7L13_23355 [Acidimicrobiia bacterium]